MDLGMAGRGCIVTGASRGIGLATARLLAREGARVLLVARREDALAEAARSCAADGGEAAALALDVTEPDAGERAVAAGEEHFGAVDVLVNNAGTSSVRSLDELTDDDWRAQGELDAMASPRIMRAAAPPEGRRGGGGLLHGAPWAG